jgi:hypothetical protein
LSRALGLHFLGDRYAYALIQSSGEAPVQVMAAGTIEQEDLAALHERLGGELNLPWCLAAENDGAMLSHLPPRWPLRAVEPEVLVHPATAAAFWDWEHGRFDEQDLYLWLRSGFLLWAKGIPGAGRAGCIPRRGPLQDNLRPILNRVQRSRCNAVVSIDGDAPGGDFLIQALTAAGHAPRELARPTQEMGADPAAAGAALAAIKPEFQAVYVPEKGPRSPHWRTAMGLGSVVALITATAFTIAQQTSLSRWQASLEAEPVSEDVEQAIAAPPKELMQLLERRQRFVQALRQLANTPPNTLAEVEILSSPDSVNIRDRVRVK